MKLTHDDIQYQAYRKLEKAMRSGDMAAVRQWSAVLDRLETTALRSARRHDQQERTYARIKAQRARERDA